VNRLRLPNRRQHEIHDLEFHGQVFTIGAGRFTDSSLAEVFIDTAKSSQMSALARDAAITLSIALQHGVTADSIRNAITRESNGIAAGLVGAVLDHLEGGANG
jgi:ribonucleoside-diphosphate reductase alpha chain